MASTDLPGTMRQIRFAGSGGPEVISVETAPVPHAGPGQVLIEVVAAGVNRPDVAQRAGSIRRRPAPPRFPASKSPVVWSRWGATSRVCRSAMRSAPW